MRPTLRGIRFLLAASLSSLLAVLFSDPLMALIAIAMICTIIFSIMDVYKRLKELKTMRVKPKEMDARLKAGETRKYLIEIYTPLPLILEPREKWIVYEPKYIKQGNNMVELISTPLLSGEYTTTTISAKAMDGLQLFQTEVGIPFKLKMKVYPRVLPWIIEALRLIGEAAYGVGETPSKRKGRGLEYLWSREYQLGDPLNIVDWKATARQVKIIIKEFSEETYGSIKVIYDIRSHGPITKDECAASFLSAVVAASKIGLPISLIIKRGDGIILGYEKLDPLQALKLALTYTIESHLTPTWDVYELLEPKSTRELMRILKELKLTGLYEIIQGNVKSFSDQFRLSLKEERTRMYLTYIGCILIDSSTIIELAYDTKLRGDRFTVLTPTKPWRDAKNLEEAYIMYHSYQKVVSRLRKLGAKLSEYKRLTPTEVTLT